jgi:hypothetical protein
LLAAVWVHALLVDGEVREYRISPDGKYIAQCRFYRESSATTTDVKTVEIRTRLNPFRRRVVDGLDYGADLSITWIDSRNLLVTCQNSGGKLDFYRKETKWHDVSIHYDLDDCQIAGAVH